MGDLYALHSFSKYLLSTYSVPGTDLDSEDTEVEKPLLLVIHTWNHSPSDHFIPSFSIIQPPMSFQTSLIFFLLYICFQGQHASLGLHHLGPKPVFELLSQPSFNLKCTEYSFKNPDFFQLVHSQKLHMATLPTSNSQMPCLQVLATTLLSKLNQ